MWSEESNTGPHERDEYNIWHQVILASTASSEMELFFTHSLHCFKCARKTVFARGVQVKRQLYCLASHIPWLILNPNSCFWLRDHFVLPRGTRALRCICVKLYDVKERTLIPNKHLPFSFQYRHRPADHSTEQWARYCKVLRELPPQPREEIS